MYPCRSLRADPTYLFTGTIQLAGRGFTGTAGAAAAATLEGAAAQWSRKAAADPSATAAWVLFSLTVTTRINFVEFDASFSDLNAAGLWGITSFNRLQT